MSQLNAILENYKPLRGWRANFVVSLEGDFHDSNRSSRGVSTPEDLALLIHLRKISDIVLVSAKSALSEKLKSTSSSTLAIVVGKEPLGDIPALSSSDNPVLVIAPQNRSQALHVPENPVVKLVLVANKTKDRIDPKELALTVESLGYNNPISEFGPTWLKQLSADQIIDELCLTITKRSEQHFRAETPMSALTNLLPESRLQLSSSFEINNTLFTRWLKNLDED